LITDPFASTGYLFPVLFRHITTPSSHKTELQSSGVTFPWILPPMHQPCALDARQHRERIRLLKCVPDFLSTKYQDCFAGVSNHCCTKNLEETF